MRTSVNRLLESSILGRKGVSRFSREPYFTRQAMNSGAHGEIEIGPYVRGVTKFDPVHWRSQLICSTKFFFFPVCVQSIEFKNGFPLDECN